MDAVLKPVAAGGAIAAGWPIFAVAGTVMAVDMVAQRELRAHQRRVENWIAEHYPQTMQVPGAPMITERRPFGTRHVPGRSPWGGYDSSHTAVDPDRIVEGAKPIRRTPDLALEFTRSAPSPGIGRGD